MTPETYSHCSGTGKFSRYALPCISVQAVTLGLLGIAAIATGRPLGLALAYVAVVSGLTNTVIGSGRSVRVFLAAATPTPLFLSLVYPSILIARGLPWIDALTLAVVGAGAFATAILAWRRYSALLKSEAAARSRAEAATAAKSTMIATISHELRTPISAIQAGALALESSAAARSEHNQASLILEAGRMMRTLLDDLLDHAKLEAGRLTVESIPTNLRDTEIRGLVLARRSPEEGNSPASEGRPSDSRPYAGRSDPTAPDPDNC